MAKVSRHALSGEEIQQFLRSFEGGAATFDRADERWTLWLPEMTPGDHPLTPASQVFFPVILRHGPQAIAIRFLYDCSAGKVRYHTSAIPPEIAGLPEFENAVSELFRHSLPVEPMRERKLGRGGAARQMKTLSLRAADRRSLAEPVTKAESALMPLEASPLPAPIVSAAKTADAAPPPAPAEIRRSIRFEVGPRARSVFIVLIVALAIVALAAVGIQAYLQSTQDPGVLHHRMMLEEMRLRHGE